MNRMTDSMQPELSIIICTYNPDAAIFSRCLESITGAIDQFKILEVIIIDNNSSFDLRAETYVQSFLSRHPNARIVSEKKQGLTPARLRGIKEASGDVLLYIDDDNFILPDFFEKGIEIATQNTHIGAWSGQVILEFEKQPEQWTHQYWGLLVYRKFGEDRWSNLPLLADTMPCGAGLFIRKIVADHYYRLHETGKRNIQMDRNGKSLFSGGDNDMAACACDIGLGVGLFHEIILTHYIPSFRVERTYLLKLAEGIAASSIVLRSYRGEITQPPSLKTRLANTVRLLLKKPVEKDFYKAVLRGEASGRVLVDKNEILPA